MTLALHYALRSDVGLLREGNEDSAYAGPRLLAIADGMGGHAAGEVASAVAISAIAPLDRQNLISDDDMLNALADAVASARATLHDMSESAAAANHPQRSLIMRALQGSTDADPDLAMHDAILGDRYLLCSDGLTDVVSDESVHHILSTEPDAEDAVNQLIALAIRNGGPDNITCIVADVVDTAAGPVPPSTEARMAGAAAGGDISALLRAATSGAPGVNGTDLGSAPGASLNGHRRRATKADDDDDSDESFDPPRRRWPVVTSSLVVLVVLIVAGLYFGYRSIQGNYYLAADGSHVTIYRGISQKIAFVSLSSVYLQTNVPTSEVPGDLSLPTTPTTLAKTKATLTQITQDHNCHVVNQQLTAWQSKHAAEIQAYDAAKKKKAKNKKVKLPSTKMPTPEPTLPSYCADGSGAG
jgi:PPM family protein phosphatase